MGRCQLDTFRYVSIDINVTYAGSFHSETYPNIFMDSGVSSGGGSLVCGASKTTTSADSVQSVNGATE